MHGWKPAPSTGAVLGEEQEGAHIGGHADASSMEISPSRADVGIPLRTLDKSSSSVH